MEWQQKETKRQCENGRVDKGLMEDRQTKNKRKKCMRITEKEIERGKER